MIHIVLKLITGEEVIGTLEIENEDDIPTLESFDVASPMWVVSEDGGSMKLRDATMLAQNKGLVFYTDNVITCYKPTEELVDYYKAAIEYSQTCTQAEINKQISHATEELKQVMQEVRDFEANIFKFAMKASKTSVH